MKKIMRQMYRMTENPSLSKTDIRLYLYLNLECAKNKTFSPYVANKLLTNSTAALLQSFNRLVKLNLIAQKSEPYKVGQHWFYDFEFSA